MRNVDKCLTKILASTNPSCEIFRLRTGDKRCSRLSCDECNKANKEWLEAEYVEPEIDWSKVPMGTPVRVWDDDSDHKYEKTFVIYNEKCVDKFITIDTKYKTIANWRYAELIEADNENSNINN